jgi:hypothetical protein
MVNKLMPVELYEIYSTYVHVILGNGVDECRYRITTVQFVKITPIGSMDFNNTA